MASSRISTGITWAAASSITTTSTTIQWSDAFTYNIEDWDAEILCKTLNNGTPASGDTASWYVAYSTDGGTTYATSEFSEFLMLLDTYAADTPGENPSARSAPLRTAAAMLKIGVQAGSATSMTHSASIETHRPQ